FSGAVLKMGEGSFGKVFHYKTSDTNEDVAVKFMRRTEAWRELHILKKIRVFDPDENCLVRVLDHFEYKSTMCLLFEKLDQTLSSFAASKKMPFEVCKLRPVAQQLMVALKALKSIGVVHCDIKLNNIMLVDQQSSPYKVKLIDFGLARKKSDLTCQSQIQVLGYRAPEVVFGCPMDEGVDMWSVGCVLASLYRGKHFYLRTCQPPDSILETGKESYEDESDLEEFKSLLKQMLNVDPTKRITPEEALNHNFITMSHLSSRTDDLYVTAAQQFMSVCQPTTSVETDAHKTDGKTVCGQKIKLSPTSTSKQDSAVPPVKKTTKKKTFDRFLAGKSYSSAKDNIDKVPHKVVDKTKHTTSKDFSTLSRGVQKIPLPTSTCLGLHHELEQSIFSNWCVLVAQGTL
uniref:Protein kinase domain-containing protein n=1 Tax=Oryzias melastigma TaxID=30732 RepID=A0A3B3DLJ9_ORYME